MAKANPVQMSPQPVGSDVDTKVAPVDVPVAGPVIEYVNEGAELVVFTPNPQATKYVVYASGMIVESL